MATTIHPTAIIERDSQLGSDCDLHAGVIIRRHTTLGDQVTVHPYAVLGGEPQDLHFDPKTESGVRIGSGTTVREYVTISRSTRSGGCTEVGKNCFLMAGVHIAHDCVVGDNVILANGTLLAGHVTVGDFVFFGGSAAVHQFCRVGESVMVGGHASITRDVPPYVMVAERDAVVGLNLVGLRRRGISRAAIVELKRAYHEVFFTAGNIREIAAAALARGGYTSVEARRFLEFFQGGKRSFARARRVEGEAQDEA